MPVLTISNLIVGFSFSVFLFFLPAIYWNWIEIRGEAAPDRCTPKMVIEYGRRNSSSGWSVCAVSTRKNAINKTIKLIPDLFRERMGLKQFILLLHANRNATVHCSSNTYKENSNIFRTMRISNWKFPEMSTIDVEIDSEMTIIIMLDAISIECIFPSSAHPPKSPPISHRFWRNDVQWTHHSMHLSI